MKNTSPDAIITLGGLDSHYYLQQLDGVITFNTELYASQNTTLRLTPSADPHTSTVELYDNVAKKVLWSIKADNQYSAQGVYLGSVMNFALHNLAYSTV